MIDISKQTVKLDCPECKRPITVSLKQVADEVTVKCNCGQGIKLTDSCYGLAFYSAVCSA